MKSIATALSGKIYAIGKDGHLYVRTNLKNQWHKTLDDHCCFSAVEVTSLIFVHDIHKFLVK